MSEEVNRGVMRQPPETPKEVRVVQAQTPNLVAYSLFKVSAPINGEADIRDIVTSTHDDLQ